MLVIIKNLYVMPVAPATKQRMSSGKKGKSIIKKKTYFPRFIFSSHFLVSSSPATQTTNFLPIFLPKKKEKTLADITAIMLIKQVIHGPNTIVPAKVVMMAGMGTKQTCKNWITKKIK